MRFFSRHRRAVLITAVSLAAVGLITAIGIASSSWLFSPYVKVGTPDASLYVRPDNPAKKVLSGYPELSVIAEQPTALWLYDSSDSVLQELRTTIADAKNQDKTPVIVVYNIPHRDCGGYSQGGASDSNAYRAWIDQVAAIIGDSKAITVIEPDALPALSNTECQTGAATGRQALIAYAAKKLHTNQNSTYVDIGNPRWLPAETAAQYLREIDAANNADGIALNVSNYYSTADNQAYAENVSKAYGKTLAYVIDTSRNGNPDFDGTWCNPPNRTVGSAPTTQTGVANDHAHLWLNLAGSSDGTCNGGGVAGSFSADRAVAMIRKK